MENFAEFCDADFKNKTNVNDDFGDTDPMIQTSLNKIIAKEGYLTHKLHKKMILMNGGNYLGVPCEITIEGETADGYKETHLFIKEQIPATHIAELLAVSEIYDNEIFFYQELCTIFTQAQDEVGLPSHERYKMAKSYNEGDSNALILENLTQRGFQTLHRMDVTPIKFAELSIIELAKFHGLSFVIQTKMPNYFEQRIKPMVTPMIYNNAWKLLIENVCNHSMKHYDIDTRYKIKNFIPTLLDRFPKYMAGEFATVKCLCHGDYRLSNIMLKKVNGEITEVVPVDYQIMHYGSPLADFIYFIVLGTDQQFRKEHLEDLKELYYRTLKEFLEEFDIDVNAFCTKKQFEVEYNSHLQLGLMIAVQYLPWFFVQEDSVPDLKEDDVTLIDFKIVDTFTERIRGIVEDFAV